MKIDDVVKILQILKEAKKENDKHLITQVSDLLDSTMDESKEYLGVVRHVIQNPENFGI